ncbi:MAG TPA: site-specific integrase [Candidatus Saccharimonadales bacterium]|jgi:integrase|nr:site-specific integrase [Candidatus Saccharimonadales bacterium]
MAQRKAKLYQRLRTKRFPWVACEMAKNGSPKPHPDAFQFGIRYTIDGQRKLDTAATLDEAVTMLKVSNVRLYANLNGVQMPSHPTSETPTSRTKIADAVVTYFANLLAQGKDPKTIRTYRYAVDGFVASCSKNYIDEIEKQDLFDYMTWLRRQPATKRKHSNPDRTYNNKLSHTVIFLKAFGKERLLKKSEYPSYEEKTVTAHPDAELALLYEHADTEWTFFLDYFLSSAVRDGEATHAEFPDLKGNVLEIKRKPHLNWKPKQHHCRKITLPQFLVNSIRAREKISKSPLIFPNGSGLPNRHLLRDFQTWAKKSGIEFHVELHKLRKTAATRWAVVGMPVHVIQRLLGHKSLETTQRYLADVDLSSEMMQKAVEAAQFKLPVKS